VIGQTQGTLYFEGSSFVDATSKRVFTISDGTLDNRIWLEFTTANVITAGMVRNTVTQASILNAGFLSNTNYKIAVTYNSNYMAFFVNGVKIGEDLALTVPICNQIRFDAGAGTFPFYGDGKAWALYTTALTDAQAISLTTP
jgi:hypothetical protein